MHATLRMEQFSRAWVHAIASVAGFSVYQPSVDDDSIDMGFAKKGGGNTCRAPRIEAQLKCTGGSVVKSDSITFPLKIKNYNDLRLPNLLVPRILILIQVPKDLDESVRQADDELTLRHCGRWVCLRGFPPTKNDSTETIHIPSKNIFDMQALRNMMNSVEESGLIKNI